MGLRKLDFDVDALGTAAAKASRVSQWTDMRLIAEGLTSMTPFYGFRTHVISRTI